MSVLPVRIYTDSVLLQPCEPVTNFNTPELIQLAQDMVETMIAYKGVGLAANQIGVNKNLCVLYLENKSKIMILANLKLLSHTKEKDVDTEGCLSAPGINISIKRFKGIEAEAQLLNGEEVKICLTEYDARIFQHEYDHLQNKCIADNIRKF